MSSDEIAVVLICLVGGYWAVSAWLGRKANPRDDPPRRSDDRTYQAPGPSRSGDSARDSDARAHPAYAGGPASTWNVTLGVAPTATRDQITSAYKQLISEYHPDKVARMGTEIRELAERKSKEINAAYDYAMRLRR